MRFHKATSTPQKFGTIMDRETRKVYNFYVKSEGKNLTLHLKDDKGRTRGICGNMKFHREGSHIVLDDIFIVPRFRNRGLSYGLIEILHQYVDEREGTFERAAPQSKPLVAYALSQSGFVPKNPHKSNVLYISEDSRPKKLKLFFHNKSTQDQFNDKFSLMSQGFYEFVEMPGNGIQLFVKTPYVLKDRDLLETRRILTQEKYSIRLKPNSSRT